MARVFLSHASEDRAWAGQLHEWLVAEGHEVFLDRDLRDGIVVGDGWEQRLRWADAVVCVVTSAAVASPWCSAEIGIAMSQSSRLLPVLAEPGVDHPLLRTAQYADLTVDSAAARAALVEALRRMDTAGASGGRTIGRRSRDCVRLRSSSIGCSSVGVVRPRNLLSCCDPRPSRPKRPCYWW
ncbi:MAG: toll/interleukin-1 receptor domain-containing protein [Pseudonocardiaceae bacterium]